MFRYLSRTIARRFGPEASDFQFVLQTQGLFNAALPGRPLGIYADYTIASHQEYPGPDRRLFRSQAFLELEHALYRRADRILVIAAHVERTLIRAYGCDRKRLTKILIGANVAVSATSDEICPLCGRSHPASRASNGNARAARRCWPRSRQLPHSSHTRPCWYTRPGRAPWARPATGAVANCSPGTPSARACTRRSSASDRTAIPAPDSRRRDRTRSGTPEPSPGALPLAGFTP